MNKITKTHINLIASVILLVLVGIAYYNFSRYEPKVNLDIKQSTQTQVMGISDNKMRIPYPINSEKIAESESPTTTDVVLHTTQPPEKIVDFYKNALVSKGWIMESQTESDNFISLNYINNGAKLNVLIAQQENKQQTQNYQTIVTIQLIKN